MAKEQAERRATAQLMFDLGQKAYGRGMYGRAIEFLEGALTIIPRPTLFGGEVGYRDFEDLVLLIVQNVFDQCSNWKWCYGLTDTNLACYGLRG